ncbi:MAG: endopeptidase La [Saprospiraceae bacterium]|nr:MAG: anti-sigma H sporulation factor LonB [Candidatus Parvibacillus calidus]MBX2937737.1 endopeptidase La [Saprospiraceae bacterium]MBK7740115.1 endopeptidase La [Candidatus Parvibacillus calidus]MCB0590512.1 endopeptidase La [Saprospiraceae bacterium]MCC7148980.1 endopeptidase La [Saprospiraceae bacterium]
MFDLLHYASGIIEEADNPFIQIDLKDLDKKIDYPELLPVLPIKNTVLFPGVVIPITVNRFKSIRAVEDAYTSDKMIMVLTQIKQDVENPGPDDMYTVGVIAEIHKLIRMPDGSITIVIQGRSRFAVDSFEQSEPYLKGRFTILEYIQPSDTREFEAQISSIKDMARNIIEISPNIPNEANNMLRNIESNTFLLNFIASNLSVDTSGKQKLLETAYLPDFANMLLSNMHDEFNLLQLKGQIESKVRTDLEKQQRDYFLSQQLKTIQEELGQNTFEEEHRNIEEKAAKKKWSAEVKAIFDKEFNKLKRMNPQMAEYGVQINYIETLLDLPWGEYSKDNFDLKKVKKVLDDDHYGLEKVKERILEHLSVLKLKGDMKAPILCLVGPPGVGKTSLGKSIAHALKRKFVRMSLGGLHDESEIRGHRKTYIGAMPGRIIQGIRKAGSSNPVFILDEIDKVGKDFRGDPSSALLEVLDPEQNNSFADNFLEVEYDLSKVLFIATANSLSTIQPALLDRMEIIDLSGYSLEEKTRIASRHLIPELMANHGLKPRSIEFAEDAVVTIISEYTRESGVRALAQKLSSVMRHYALKIAMGDKFLKKIRVQDIHTILGAQRYSNDIYTEKQPAGVAIGLAWTSVGGDILFIESSLSKGKGKLILTGNLGDVMKESASTALSFVRAHADQIGINPEDFEQYDLHIHVPEGAIPKDGPSAGVTMLSAICSAFAKKPIRPYLAMTGEITLRGKVLPVGGIKEKVLAAKRAGLKEILMCRENEKNVAEIPAEYIEGITFKYVDRMSEVLEYALSISM